MRNPADSSDGDGHIVIQIQITVASDSGSKVGVKDPTAERSCGVLKIENLKMISVGGLNERMTADRD